MKTVSEQTVCGSHKPTKEANPKLSIVPSLVFTSAIKTMMTLRGSAIWVALISILLLVPPADKEFVVGDFLADEYRGKLNPLSDDSIVVEDYFFPSVQGEKCHAWLYYSKVPVSPVDGDPQQHESSSSSSSSSRNKLPPVVLMAPGLGTQKDFGLDRYAERFVQAGFAVFMFDYRNFGASEGKPRNWISPKRHIEDYHAALDYIESSSSSSSSSSSNDLRDKVDTSSIALWGTSFSGGHVLEVASQRSNDTNIIGVVSQVPHLSGKVAAKNGIKQRGLVKVARLVVAALQDTARSFVGLPPVGAKIIGSGDDIAIMSVSPEDHARYVAKQPAQKLGGWINQTPARILLEIRFYSPIETLQKKESKKNNISVPVLLIGAALDDLCPPDLIEKASSLIPRSILIVREGTHFQIYEPQNWKEMADEMVQFFTSCIASR